ncbi:hypothetical protein BDEG_28747 [Batrachochytrium dendrobatidis JEL423]|uniref:Uncharacterized protein n=1 Tax=Batrachochytrium dendrobatidis (strain JEL423) TaxID=403673 RepID=A0A177VZM6_BATDL|nr:hypothetical protein BDEG_28747 [Batrachochytrium dendrobatidis JEL423]
MTWMPLHNGLLYTPVCVGWSITCSTITIISFSSGTKTTMSSDLSLSDSGLEQDIAKWICDNLVESPTLGQSDVGSARMDFYQAHICQPTISSILKWNNTYRKLTLVSD